MVAAKAGGGGRRGRRDECGDGASPFCKMKSSGAGGRARLHIMNGLKAADLHTDSRTGWYTSPCVSHHNLKIIK